MCGSVRLIYWICSTSIVTIWCRTNVSFELALGIEFWSKLEMSTKIRTQDPMNSREGLHPLTMAPYSRKIYTNKLAITNCYLLIWWSYSSRVTILFKQRIFPDWVFFEAKTLVELKWEDQQVTEMQKRWDCTGSSLAPLWSLKLSLLFLISWTFRCRFKGSNPGPLQRWCWALTATPPPI